MDINLDALPEEDLGKFWMLYREPELDTLRKLLPAELFPDEEQAMDIAATLAAYAMAKKCAIGLRLAGAIDRAQVYESHCDIYYQELPEEVKW